MQERFVDIEQRCVGYDQSCVPPFQSFADLPKVVCLLGVETFQNPVLARQNPSFGAGELHRSLPSW